MSFDDTEELRKKIRALIVFRVIFVTLLLGSSYLFKGVENVASIHAFSYIVVSFYFVTIIYSLLLGRIRNLFFFGYVQLIIDIFLETALIYITGGIESWFSFLLIFSVIASSIVLNKKAGYVSATLSCVLYGVLLNLQLFRVLPLIPDTVVEAQDYFYNIFVHVVSLYLTAYLSGYLSSALEKTEQKLEEKKLDFRDLEFFNREVIENMQSGLFTTDMSGTVMIFNRAAENILGVRKKEIVGKRIDSVVPFFEFPFSEGRKENSIHVNNQEKIIGLGISTLTGGDAQPKGYIIIFQDLTELKLLEMEMKQREKWAAIGELSSNIAHEIRNPLASLRGSIEMLKEDTVPGNYKTRLMEIAVSEMDRLNRIITDFLTYSRPSPPELKEFDLHELLDETTELLKNLEHTGLKVKKIYSGNLPITADPQKMRQVFWNLGLNAMEAMPAEGELVISTENTDGFATITFRDTGPGIGTEELEKIFYPFFTTKEQGTGLGLAIAYRIVEEHRGSIKLKSTPGSGSTFEIILPKAHEKS
jgi:two-component system sensor histidine kinase PilS (NtrC family)